VADRPSRASAGAAVSRRERTRTIVAVVALTLFVLFAVLNLDDVEVNWIIGTWTTPLILVIAISFVLGAAVGAFVARRRRSRY
jgi:uncharacterized integral membrane protein